MTSAPGSQSAPPSEPASSSPVAGLPTIDVAERGGRDKDGNPQTLDKRLFMQLAVYRVDQRDRVTAQVRELEDALRRDAIRSVIYADVHDARGIALLSWSDDPAHFVDAVRPLFDRAPLDRFVARPEMSMLGRTYATGHEPRLDYTLLTRPIDNVTNPAWPWAIWYPLRRTGAFSRLEPKEQSVILREHATIGLAYGAQDLAHDVRLACHGLDANDNDFIVGLVGRDLHPLSHVVQKMRGTRQTSEFIEKMGPFFVGRVIVVT